ncbi:MAG: cupin domain-containing protein [Pseudomonadota bacterium]
MSKDGYFVSKTEIEQMESVEKAHFLNANARCQNKSLGDLTGLTGIGFHILDVAPGRDTTELHMHYREDECVFILAGRGLAQVGDESFEVAAGDFLGYRKGGLPHSLTNTGSETLRCIVVGQRGDTDVVDYPQQNKRMFRTRGLDWNVVDTADIKPR